MATYSEHEQRMLDAASGAELDRISARRAAMVFIIRLRQISTGEEADSMLFRGTEAEASAYAEAALAGHANLEIVSVRPREAR